MQTTAFIVQLGAAWSSPSTTSPAPAWATDAMLGLEPKTGGATSAVPAILILLSKRAGMALDRIVMLLSAVMIVLMLSVAIVVSMRPVPAAQVADAVLITSRYPGAPGDRPHTRPHAHHGREGLGLPRAVTPVPWRYRVGG